MMVKPRVRIWDLPMEQGSTEILEAEMGTIVSFNNISGELEVTADAMSTPGAACALPDGNPAVGKKFSITIQAGKNGGGPPAMVEVLQDDGNGDQTLAQTTIELSEAVTMDVTSVGTFDPRIRVSSGDVGATIRIQLVTYKEIDEVQEDVVVMECNTDEFGGDYRFGFNGQVKDNNLKGIGNSLDFKFRIFDSRLGRFLSIDPLATKFPMLSSYQFASNRPIDAIDLDGTEAVPLNDGNTLYGPWASHIFQGEDGKPVSMLQATYNIIRNIPNTPGSEGFANQIIINNYQLYKIAQKVSVLQDGEVIAGNEFASRRVYQLKGMMFKALNSDRPMDFLAQAIVNNAHEWGHDAQEGIEIRMTNRFEPIGVSRDISDNQWHDKREFFANYFSAYPNEYPNFKHKIFPSSFPNNIKFPENSPSESQKIWRDWVIRKFSSLSDYEQKKYGNMYEKAKKANE